MDTAVVAPAPPAGRAYRADIDGLRGVAVLAVIGFHAFPGLVRGGYVGVDVFFVISGYLITGIIVDALERGRFTFSGFYVRRIKRIFPALVVVLAGCAAWGWFTLFADDYRQLGKYTAGSAGFAANFFLWRDTWYFDAAAERKPLLHLWSLGIEEQFYLVWPLMLYFAFKRRASVLWLTTLVLAASLTASAYQVRHDATAAFYSPITRMWELALGGLVACAVPLVSDRWQRLPGAVRTTLALAGLAVVLTSVFSIAQNKAFLGLRATLPTIGAALLLAAGPTTWPNRMVLARRALVWIGLISYPLYLWHWPLLAFGSIAHSVTPPVTTRLLLIAASVLFAWVTYRAIEHPIRFGPARAATIPALSSALALLLVAGTVTYWKDGFPDRTLNLSDKARFLQFYERLHSQGLAKAYWSACDFTDWETHRTKDFIAPECTQRGDRGTVLLWGDSYAQALSLGIRRLLPPGVRLAQVATAACPPSETRVDNPGDPRCSHSNSRALAAIAELAPDAVVLAQMSLHQLTDWESLAARIRGLGARRVVLMGPTTRWVPALPVLVANRYWNRDYARIRDGVDPKVFVVDAELKRRFAHSAVLEYVSMLDRLCDAEGCVATVPGGDRQDLIAVDGGHLSPNGSVFVVQQTLASKLSGL